jgi:diguanylate cyclase (GGDEF)-like protein
MNVLIAEDDRVSRMTLSACLRGWGFEVIAVDNGQQAFDVLAQPDGPRLALLDWEMPGLDGIEVCARLRAVSGLPFRYLIVLTGREREEDIVAALDRGADDFITKPWKPGELRARLGVGQRMVQLQEQIEENHRTLSRAAQTDYLTGIWNRSAVMRRLEEEVGRSDREHAPLSVLMFDVDHFKNINDTHGHVAGDVVLIEVARRLREACRVYDVVGRYGGEEFLAVVPLAPYAEVEKVAERFRAAIADGPVRTEQAVISVTMSVGAVWREPGGRAGVDALVQMADKMLYQAKENGRNRVELRPFE